MIIVRILLFVLFLGLFYFYSEQGSVIGMWILGTCLTGLVIFTGVSERMKL
jgi:hypothetical protein